jgi:N-acetylglutamate synthase-like GNAT family acetyltransferase
MWTIYQHHKGLFYLSLGSACHSENMEPQTVYLALYENPRGSLWVRPSSMFFDNGGPRNSKRFTPVARLRCLALNEAHTVLPFGFDAWGAGRSLEEFVRSYETNKNHLRGQRFVLETNDGAPLATVNTLRLSPDVMGLAWLATHPEHRKSGHASLLMRAVMALMRHEKESLTFLLHSEIGIRFYEKFGFEKAPVEHQHFEKSVAMVALEEDTSTAYESHLREYF